eukprot:tig00000113_g5708.t1
MVKIMVDRGFEAYRARQLHDYVYKKGARTVESITVFSKQMRETLKDVNIGRLDVVEERETLDGTVKMLLRLPDGNVIEAVGIPTSGRLTVCVSSQVGCAMRCDFCATGKGGFVRNLHVNEIVDQVLTIQERMERRVSHIVFMGMGEPLNNLDSVLRSVRCLNEDVGIGLRHITISTVGIQGKIRELARYHLQSTLAVSLHAPNQEVRFGIIPTAEHYPIDELLAECREYVETTGRRISFEYTLLEGVNDHPEHAVELAKRLRGFQAHVNLIPWNPIEEGGYRRPGRGRVGAFAEALESRRVAVSVRRTRGSEKDAACGQLRASRAAPAPAPAPVPAP